MTSSKDACSGPDHVLMTETPPETSLPPSPPPVSAALLPAPLVVVSTASGCERGEGEHEHEHEEMKAMLPHQLAPFVVSSS